MPAAMPNLTDAVWTMLTGALEIYQDSPRASHWLHQHAERFAEPVRVAVVGPPGSGKSTLVNALVGERIGPIHGGDGAQVFTWYQDGPEPRATVHPYHGPPEDVPVARHERQLHIELGHWQAQWQPWAVNRLVVDWPARTLRDTTLIDTPAIPPVPTDDAATTPERIVAEADAVLYLTRQPGDVDLGFLRATLGAAGAVATPANTIMVLSRADEIGGGRIDALTSAKQVARRYRADPGIRGLCQNVVAVAGLLGQAGRTLAEPEFAALATLSGTARDQMDALLLSADRFSAEDLPVGVDAELRRALLERMGVFGVRLSTTLIRRGYDTHTKLAAQLVQRSGVSELRDSLAQLFVERRGALKARSALLALATVLRNEPRPQARRLVTDTERALASSNDFAELRVLAALQAGRTALPTELAAEAQRLVGAGGTSAAERLGINFETTEERLRQAAFEALLRWREQAENPVLDNAQRETALVVARSCEGILAGLPVRSRQR